MADGNIPSDAGPNPSKHEGYVRRGGDLRAVARREMAGLVLSLQRLQAAACFLAPFAMLSSMLSSLSFLAFATLQGCHAVSVSSLQEEEPSRLCKAAPGSADWPTAQTWADFNQTVGGRLIKAVPPAAVVSGTLIGARSSCCRIAQDSRGTWGNPLC